MNNKHSTSFPNYLWLLLALYIIASLTHFIHNAEYLAFYPNMPQWITRQTVYVAWLVVSIPGVLALLLHVLGWRMAALVMLMVYGATGFDGLGHYALALCVQHTLAQNFTIWFEVVAGAALMVTSLLTLLQKSNREVIA